MDITINNLLGVRVGTGVVVGVVSLLDVGVSETVGVGMPGTRTAVLEPELVSVLELGVMLSVGVSPEPSGS